MCAAVNACKYVATRSKAGLQGSRCTALLTFAAGWRASWKQQQLGRDPVSEGAAGLAVVEAGAGARKARRSQANACLDAVDVPAVGLASVHLYDDDSRSVPIQTSLGAVSRGQQPQAEHTSEYKHLLLVLVCHQSVPQAMAERELQMVVKPGPTCDAVDSSTSRISIMARMSSSPCGPSRPLSTSRGSSVACAANKSRTSLELLGAVLV